MKPDNEQNDKQFFSALGAEKPEAFWRAQRASIMDALPSRTTAQFRLTGWKLAPAFATLALGAAWLFYHEKPQPPAPPQADARMLENLGLLDEMDLLERIPEQELI